MLFAVASIADSVFSLINSPQSRVNNLNDYMFVYLFSHFHCFLCTVCSIIFLEDRCIVTDDVINFIYVSGFFFM